MKSNLSIKITNFFKLLRLKSSNSKLLYFGCFALYAIPFGYFLYKNNGGSQPFSLQKFITKTTKEISTQYIPIGLRNFIYTKYATKYGVNLDQVQKPLNQYQNLSQFFIRKIKPREQLLQQIKSIKLLGCPCDSQILSIEKINQDQNLIIKDVKYSLNKLIFHEAKPLSYSDIQQDFLCNKQNSLYQVIFYLCPGDYHRFHSPFDLKVYFSRDIEGSLKPVNTKSLLKNGGVVYEQNARKILHCIYNIFDKQKGSTNMFLNLVMIGALNVGDIHVNQKPYFTKGQQIGYFNLGSTVVMIIQLPNNIKWNKKVGDKVRFGEKLCQFL